MGGGGGGCFEALAKNPVRSFGVMLGGACLGALLSFVVNCTLVEISLNPFFSFYFGILFIVVGIAILWRVNSHGSATKRWLLFLFATAVLVSGFLCFFFDKNWVFTLSAKAKIPLYATIGLSTCFAITFCSVDLINFCCDQMNPNKQPLVESPAQVHLVLFISVVMGIGYGYTFGFMDVGKTATNTEQLQSQLEKQEIFCLPFGVVLGALGAGLNEYYRYNQSSASDRYKYSPLFQDDDDAI